MFIPEYDLTTGLPSYWAWALPGALTSQAVWRIVKWTWSGTAGTLLWADGNNNLDNVYDNRASLSYVANAALSLEFASHLDLVPAGIPGSSFNVGFTIPDDAVAWLNSSPMQRVPAAPGPQGNQSSVSGAVLQTGVSIGAADWFFLRVPLA